MTTTDTSEAGLERLICTALTGQSCNRVTSLTDSDREAPAATGGPAGKGLRVVAVRRAFESVEQHQQRQLGRRRGRNLVDLPVDIDEIAVRGAPTFAPPAGRRAGETARHGSTRRCPKINLKYCVDNLFKLSIFSK